MIDYLAALPWWAWLWLLAALVFIGTVAGVAIRRTFVPVRWQKPVVAVLVVSLGLFVGVPVFIALGAFFYLATGSMP